MLPVQDLWTYTDETIVLHCNVPFPIPTGLPITWMFAPNVSCTWACKGVSRHSEGGLSQVQGLLPQQLSVLEVAAV